MAACFGAGALGLVALSIVLANYLNQIFDGAAPLLVRLIAYFVIMGAGLFLYLKTIGKRHFGRSDRELDK